AIGFYLFGSEMELLRLPSRAKPVEDGDANREVRREAAIAKPQRVRIEAVLKDEAELRLERRTGDLRFGLKAALLGLEQVEFEPSLKRDGVVRRFVRRRGPRVVGRAGGLKRSPGAVSLRSGP